MKRAILLIIFLMGLVVAYGAYLLVTFHPDEPYEFSFNEPTLPPELLAEQEQMTQQSTLSPEEIKRRDAAMSAIRNAIDSYQRYEEMLPAQANSTLSTLNNYFLSGDLPAFFIGATDAMTGQRQFGSLALSTSKIVEADSSKKTISCDHDPSGSETLIGSEDDNIIECDSINRGIGAGDRLILGGPGDDKITDTAGNRIVNGGSGNDTIALGVGRSIIVLEDGWGQDQLTVDCSVADISPSEVPAAFPMPWVYKTINFIVLSPRIDPSDLAWDGLVLRSKSGSDTLTVNQNCFTIVPALPVIGAPAAQ